MTDEEAIKARIRELEAKNEKLEELKTRAEQAEAKLRELAEAAAWQAECLEAVDYCLKQRNAFVYVKRFWERWNEAHWHSTKLFEQAEADYQAALKAAMRKN